MAILSGAGLCVGVGIIASLSGVAFIAVGTCLVVFAAARAATILWRGR